MDYNNLNNQGELPSLEIGRDLCGTSSVSLWVSLVQDHMEDVRHPVSPHGGYAKDGGELPE